MSSSLNIYQKLVEVRRCVPYLQKESTGAQYKYVGSSQVLGSLKAKMDDVQLLLIPRITGHKISESVIEFKDTTGNVTKRTTTYFTEIDMTMTWVNAEKPDETIECSWYGQGVDIAGEKGLGKALTYGEKYFMLKFFNIATDKDDPDSFQKKYDEEDDKPKGDNHSTKPNNTYQQEVQGMKEAAKNDNKPPQVAGDCISDAQARRLYALSGSKKDVCEKVLSYFGYKSSKEIKKSDYEMIAKAIEAEAVQDK